MCENMDAQAHSMKGKGGPDYPRIMYFDISYTPPSPPPKKMEDLGQKRLSFFFPYQDFG